MSDIIGYMIIAAIVTGSLLIIYSNMSSSTRNSQNSIRYTKKRLS